MTASTTPIATAAPAPDFARRTPGWERLLMVSVAVVAVVDIVFMGLAAEVIPPLAMSAVLTFVGLALMRVRRTPGIIVLMVVTLVMFLGGLPFNVVHFASPESGVDWFHSVIGVFGRLFVLGVAIKAWRARNDDAARMAGVLALGLLGVVATVALVATAATSGDERRDGDITVAIDSMAFPEQIRVEPGEVLFIDNTHIFRHSFTVVGTDIDVELPALQAVRVPIDLPAGTYEVICDVPGHEAMSTVLVVG